jgi:hypothetical protein
MNRCKNTVLFERTFATTFLIEQFKCNNPLSMRKQCTLLSLFSLFYPHHRIKHVERLMTTEILKYSYLNLCKLSFTNKYTRLR